ncbi:MAG: hypothetical protein ACT4OT_13685 [Acidobacteriota bacterium]
MKFGNVQRLTGLCLGLLLFQFPLLAATLKKKNGEVIEGTIQGLIVQRDARESSVKYVIRKGSDVVAIDERGVVVKKGAKMDILSIYIEGKSADEIERLGGAGGLVLRMSGEGKDTVDPLPLLGEYTGNLNNREIKGAVVNSIRIKTKDRILTVLVSDLIEFGKTEAQ